MPLRASCFLILLLALASIGGVARAQSSFRDEGTMAYRSGDYKKAIELYEKSLATALKVLKEDDMEIMERRAELGEAYRAAGRWNEAITQLDYVWKRARYEAESKQHWNAQEGNMTMGYGEKLGKTCMGAGRYEDGIMVFKTLLADAERTKRIGDAMQFSALLAEAQFLANHADDAAASVRHSAELSSNASIDPALQARALAQLSALCLRQRRPEAAKPLAERGLALAIKVYSPTGLTVSGYQELTAQVLLATNELDEAAKHLQAARDAILSEETEDSPRLLDVLLDEAALALKREQYDQALAKGQKALTLAKKRYPDEHPQTARALAQVARAYMALNQPAKAQPLLSQALAVLEKTLGEDDPQTMEVRDDAVRLGPHLSPAKSSASRDPKK
jgi:hypothetical protein